MIATQNSPRPSTNKSNVSLASTYNSLSLISALYDDPSPSTSKAINKLKRFYSACMNTSLLNDVKTGELLRNLEKIGYWPIVHGQKFDSPHFDLTETLIKMAKVRALDVFFAAYGNVDLNNVSRLLIHFDRGSLGMSIPQFYLNPKRFGVQLSAYEHYMRNIAQLIARDAHSNQTYEQIDKDVKSIINVCFFYNSFISTLFSLKPNSLI
jgi:predicted metalloendopeptidase